MMNVNSMIEKYQNINNIDPPIIGTLAAERVYRAQGGMNDENVVEFRRLTLQHHFADVSTEKDGVYADIVYITEQLDFPLKWPELSPILSKFSTGSDLNHLVALLTSMEQIFRKFRYESKSTELWKELLKCLLSTQEPLTLLLRNMMEVCQGKDSLGDDEMAQWLDKVRLSSNLFYSLCVQSIPKCFENDLEDWLSFFLELIQIDVPSQTSAAGELTTLEELKHEICEIFTLYSQRYEEEIAPYVPDIISSIWRLLETIGPETRYDTMVCAALEFLSTVSQRKFYEAHFSGEKLLESLKIICNKGLRLTEEDMKLFEDEPLDYMKKDIEGTDVGSRRREILDFVGGLCRRFKDEMIPCLDSIIKSLLASDDWIKIDIVYSLVTAIAEETEPVQNGVTATKPSNNINDFFINQVATHLDSDVNQLPILKVDALKFAVTFRKQLAPKHLMTAIKASDALLSSNSPIVQKYAAYAIEQILDSDSNNVFSHNLVATILQNLVAAFDKDPSAQNSPYLIKAILRIIVILDDETIRHADAIVRKLAQLIESATTNPAVVVNKVDKVYVHFLFETISVIVTKTRTIGASLDAQLLPLIEVIFRKDLGDMIPYAVQLMVASMAKRVAEKALIEKSKYLPILLSKHFWSFSEKGFTALDCARELYSGGQEEPIGDEMHDHTGPSHRTNRQSLVEQMEVPDRIAVTGGDSYGRITDDYRNNMNNLPTENGHYLNDVPETIADTKYPVEDQRRQLDTARTDNSMVVDEDPLRELKMLRRRMGRISARVFELEENNERRRYSEHALFVALLCGAITAVWWNFKK
uniref:Cse1 n=1 Tax=Caenorhabditis tropicalis TaxID=1561998 RepID=A0A1I7U5X8_9PELO